MAEDKEAQDAERYRKGLLQSFGVTDAVRNRAGQRAADLYEAGMRTYHADPVAPIRRRLELFLKRLHKPKNWDAEEYNEVKVLCAAIERNLEHVVECRGRLLEIAEAHGIKLKKGIVL